MPKYPEKDYLRKEKNYYIELDVDYDVKETFVSISEKRYTKGLSALAWVSDFCPFDSMVFSDYYGKKKYDSFNSLYSCNFFS